MTENTNQEKNPSGALSIIADTIAQPHTVLAFAALCAQAAGYMLSLRLHKTEGADSVLVSGILVFCIILAAQLILAVCLKGAQISGSIIKAREKAIDPSFTGVLSDVSGAGAVTAALAAVSGILSVLYTTDSSVYSSGYFYIPLIQGTGQAVMLWICLSHMVSYRTMLKIFFTVLSRHTGLTGEKLLKAAERASSYRMTALHMRRTLSVARTAQLCICALCVIAALSASAIPFTLTGVAVICLMLTVFGAAADKASPDDPAAKPHEEKTPLTTKDTRSFAVLNCICFIAVGVLFLYSFPIRSVYTDYVIQHDFDYDSTTQDIQVFSSPGTDRNVPLFLGFSMVMFLFTGLLELVATGYDKQTFGSRPERAAGIKAGVSVLLITAYYIAAIYFFPGMKLDPLMWLVCISVVCLMLGINLIRALAISRQ